MVSDRVDGIVDLARTPLYPLYMRCRACGVRIGLRKDGKVKAHRRNSLAGRYGYNPKRIKCEGSGREPMAD